MSGLLRHAGWSEGTVGILPLILFAAGILLKPRAVEFIERRRKDSESRNPAIGRLARWMLGEKAGDRKKGNG